MPGAGGYRIEFFCPMAIHAHTDRHITLPSAFETLKPQQDSWTGQAKRMPKKLFHVTFGIQKKKQFFWSTCHAIRTPKNCFTLPTECMKSYRISSTKNRRKSLQEMPLPSASETLKHQQDSWPSQAKRPKKLFHVTFGTHNLQCFWSTSLARRTARKGIESPASKPLKIVARDAFAKRLRNTQTPAGFVAKPSKTHAKKTVSRYLWNP